uniref:Glutathione transferase n=1 Tax=Denticeps clupeoides TaxID=299321 RepID=A0AAY4AUC5_9TELE
MEKVIPFVPVGLLCALTRPDLSTAVSHFLVLAASRFCHSVVYLMPIPSAKTSFSATVQPCASLFVASHTLPFLQ